jgi:hypothetical protein
MQKDLECSRNPLNNLGVIPGKLAIASATRNPGKSKTSGYPPFDAAQDMLSRVCGGALADLFCELWFRDTRRPQTL